MTAENGWGALSFSPIENACRPLGPLVFDTGATERAGEGQDGPYGDHRAAFSPITPPHLPGGEARNPCSFLYS